MRSRLLCTGVVLIFVTYIEAMPAAFQLPANTTAKDLGAMIRPGKVETAHALFFQTNAAGSENEVIACGITKTGQVGGMRRYKTGGKGFPSSDKEDPDQPHVPGRRSVVIGKNHLFAVNSGSNDVSMFDIHPENPTILRQVGKPITSHGTFPVALAYCPFHHLLCVANGGKVDGIACYRADPFTGLKCLDKTLRKVRAPGQEKNDAPKGVKASTNMFRRGTKNDDEKTKEAIGIISDMMFTADGKHLIVISKSPTSSIIDVFPVTKGNVCRSRVRSIIKDAPKLFGTIQVCETEFFATDGSFGVAKLSFDPKTLKMTLKNGNTQKIDFQVITGPIALSTKRRTVFAGDLKINRIVEFDAKTGNRAGEESFRTNQPGNKDVAIGGDFLYALSPENKDQGADKSLIQTMFIGAKDGMVNTGAFVFESGEKISKYASGLVIYDKKNECSAPKLPFTKMAGPPSGAQPVGVQKPVTQPKKAVDPPAPKPQTRRVSSDYQKEHLPKDTQRLQDG
ncbi:hypothetical protein ABW21_db0206614 [Orbilia brochopaga]|nr:hypothetical protein ABW21_db0206614 [Drechslerella brochopaga]